MSNKIKELAPTLIDSGISVSELKQKLRPKNDPPPPEKPKLAPKRYRMVMENLLRGEDLSTAARKACVPLDVAQIVKDEIEAVRESLNILKKSTRIS